MATLTKKEFSEFIKDFKFRELFNYMGWNNDKISIPIAIETNVFELKSIAEKSGFKILVCNSNKDKIPTYEIRKQIENKVTKLFQEHLIIFINELKKEHIWHLVIRQANKPSKLIETKYNISQDPELLYQRTSGIFFELDEEDKITIIDVKQRVSSNFNANSEKITKKFYEKFKKEHKSFLEFINGIKSKVDNEWYASLMLNRLMFCYFIQKKGFLDNDPNYLRNKLKQTEEKRGKNNFYSFYRDFLLILFHQGLGANNHTKEIELEIGSIPYLNGGLFDVHELEKNYKDINIKDEAFEKLFDFFDQYEWHLDTRIDSSGKDINPDVIGYIFEKYINDRAQMGAYYTKEDITEYISKNCIIPFLFDETKRNYKNEYTEIWELLKESGDKYIYDAVKHGCLKELPDEIKIGIDTETVGLSPLLERRKEWNKPASDDLALPTEIWREVVERRNRYFEIKAKIKKGEIKEINDFITYNLNIRQFTQDIIENTNDPEFIKHFYKALSSVTILDPTCGSGAFLFSAMNILEPLYESSIQRMENFVSDGTKGKYKFFEGVIEQVKSPNHPNLQYFIYKSIILRNLYGVDIMKEAVEIAKLRLFLKLVATVDVDYTKPNFGLEPLPDVDFNIRSGNSLIGFATKEDLDTGFGTNLLYLDSKDNIYEKCDVVAKAFERYKEIQLSYGDDFSTFKKSKDNLNKRLKELNNCLDNMLYSQYSSFTFDNWLETHQPFHWFSEFYEIIHEKGGFDVIIGNPPYVVYNDVKKIYTVKNYATEKSNDLYSFIIERSTKIKSIRNYSGMIIPISIISTDGFHVLSDLIINKYKSNHFSSYSMRPSKLFDTVDKHLCIWIGNSEYRKNSTYSSKYHRWTSDERETLFPKLKFIDITSELFHNNSIPKIGSFIEKNILNKLKSQNKNIGFFTSKMNKHILYHTRKLRYFLQFIDTPPKIFEDTGDIRVTSELKEFNFETELDRNVALSSYLSSLFFWYYISYSDCRNVNKREVFTFPLNIESIDKNIKNILFILSKNIMFDLQKNSYMQTSNYKKHGKLSIQVFSPRQSKPIIDEIDKVLAEHYGFTQEELDFIINYDIKYRMGKELDNEDEE